MLIPCQLQKDYCELARMTLIAIAMESRLARIEIMHEPILLSQIAEQYSTVDHTQDGSNPKKNVTI